MNDTSGKCSFGEYIRKKRLEAGLTQKELAARLHVTESAVSKWERELSYPDISMVTAICSALNISEHEFFTACDDDQARIRDREAASWRKLSASLLRFLSGTYMVAVVTCFICDLAIFHALDWFWIVLTALMLAFSLTCLPFLVKKHRLTICLGVATGSLLLLLLACWLYTGSGRWMLGATVITAVCLALPWTWWALFRFYGKHLPPLFMAAFSVWVFVLLAVIRGFTGGNWLLSLAFPIAAFFVAYSWLFFATLYRLPVGAWLKAALCVLLSTFLVPLGNTLSSAMLSNQHTPTLADYFSWGCLLTHEDVNGASWVNVLVFVILLPIAAVFLAIGIVTELQMRRSRKK